MVYFQVDMYVHLKLVDQTITNESYIASRTARRVVGDALLLDIPQPVFLQLQTLVHMYMARIVLPQYYCDRNMTTTTLECYFYGAS